MPTCSVILKKIAMTIIVLTGAVLQLPLVKGQQRCEGCVCKQNTMYTQSNESIKYGTVPLRHNKDLLSFFSPT